MLLFLVVFSMQMNKQQFWSSARGKMEAGPEEEPEEGKCLWCTWWWESTRYCPATIRSVVWGKARGLFIQTLRMCRRYILMVSETRWKWSESHFVVWWRGVGEKDSGHFSQAQIAIVFWAFCAPNLRRLPLFLPTHLHYGHVQMRPIVNMTGSQWHRRKAFGGLEGVILIMSLWEDRLWT